MNMLEKPWADAVGKLIVRATIAGLMLFHGIHKIQTGVEWMIPMLQAKGAPEIMRYGVFVGEIVAPVFILIGFWTRTAAFVLFGNLVVAIWLAHDPSLFVQLDPKSGGWALELQGWYIFTALAVIFMGPGKYSVDGCLGLRHPGTDSPAAGEPPRAR
jgi:putative oxidoreductase